MHIIRNVCVDGVFKQCTGSTHSCNVLEQEQPKQKELNENGQDGPSQTEQLYLDGISKEPII